MPTKARREKDKFWNSGHDDIKSSYGEGGNDDLKPGGLLGTNYVQADPITGDVYTHDKHAGGGHNIKQLFKKIQTAQALKTKHADIWEKRGSSPLIQTREARNGNTISTRTIRAYQKLLDL